MDQNESTRTVKVRIGADQMRHLLGLPPGAHVVSMRADMDPVELSVLVWSRDFPFREGGPAAESVYVRPKMVTVDPVDEPPPFRPEWEWPSVAAEHAAAEKCPLCGGTDRHSNNGCPESWHFRKHDQS